MRSSASTIMARNTTSTSLGQLEAWIKTSLSSSLKCARLTSGLEPGGLYGMRSAVGQSTGIRIDMQFRRLVRAVAEIHRLVVQAEVNCDYVCNVPFNTTMNTAF